MHCRRSHPPVWWVNVGGFSFYENQVMHCKFVDVASGREQVFGISAAQSEGAVDSDIDKFTVE